MEFKHLIFQAWKVMEFNGQFSKSHGKLKFILISMADDKMRTL